MKTHLIALLLVFLGAGIQAQEKSQDSHDGYWWEAQSESFKVGMVMGYVTAMVRAADTIGFKCLADKNGGVLPQTVPSKDVLRECTESPTMMAFDFQKLRFGQLVDGVTDFYKDYRNKGIDVNQALMYTRDVLKGKPSKELEEELTRWRKPSKESSLP